MEKNDFLQCEFASIFPAKITAGITLANKENFPPIGFSISPGPVIDSAQARANQAFLSRILGISTSQLKIINQVHGAEIVDASKNKHVCNGDGLICCHHNMFLCVSVADCAAVLLAAPDSMVIAAIHSGWRGTRENIVGKAVTIMVEKYRIEPRKIFAYISPCASQKKYEISQDVAQYFPDHIEKISRNKWLLDIRGCIKDQLLEAGIESEKMEIARGCTIGDIRYHSYRRDRENSGRMAAFIGVHL